MVKANWVRLRRIGVAGGGLLAVLASLIAVADGLPKYWRLLTDPGQSANADMLSSSAPTAAPPPGSPEISETAAPASSPLRPSDTPTLLAGSKTPEGLPRREPISSHFRLQAGQQRVLLDGRLGVAVDFSEVAGTRIATLRINGDRNENHALLSSGASYTVTIDNMKFRVSVLELDLDREAAVIQVNELTD